MVFIIDSARNEEPKWQVVICGQEVLVSEGVDSVLSAYDATLAQSSTFQAHIGSFKSHSVNVVALNCQADINYVGWQWLGIRASLNLLTRAQFNIVGRALQLMRWHFEHQFCGRCGAKTESTDNARARGCLACDLHYYPRISPCVIGIIVRGDECLLARNANHPPGLFSTVAGFIEAGESAEEAFAREVHEEVGVQIDKIEYLFSQPWPFPGQLMLGFVANYKSGEVNVDNDEIVEARWFTRHNLPQTPLASTISGKLIERFIHNTLRQT